MPYNKTQGVFIKTFINFYSSNQNQLQRLDLVVKPNNKPELLLTGCPTLHRVKEQSLCDHADIHVFSLIRHDILRVCVVLFHMLTCIYLCTRDHTHACECSHAVWSSNKNKAQGLISVCEQTWVTETPTLIQLNLVFTLMKTRWFVEYILYVLLTYEKQLCLWPIYTALSLTLNSICAV